ncbi:MAG: restriction endonuclease subunit S [Anaerolineaceae bacterium]|nr:restriction endonuclease subunit S [Anaerolineaceae bacterium]
MGRTVELGTLITPAKNVRCGNGNYPVLSMTMHNGLIFQDEKFKKVIASKDKTDYKVVYRNQLVISFPIDEGVLASQRITDAGIVSPAYGIWDIDQIQILPEFLEYALRSNRAIQYYKAKLRGSTARRRSLPTPTLLAFMIPLPSIEEQKKILKNMHKIRTIIRKRETQLNLMNDLIKARFVEMFEGDFPQITANAACEAIVDCPHTTPKYIGNELICPAIRTSEIKNGFIDWTSMKYVSREECRDRNKRLTPKRGDIVYAREGTYGDCVILPNGYDFCLGQRTMLFRPNYDLITSEYLHQALRSDNVKRQADISNAGSTVPHVNVADAKEFSFPLPPLELQNTFGDFVAQVDKSKDALTSILSLEEDKNRKNAYNI